MIEQIREVLTPEQAADYLQVNRETIYRYIREGKLAASKLGRTYRLPKRSLDMLLWARRTREDITLREYTRTEITGFIEADQLDEEAQEIVTRFLFRQRMIVDDTKLVFFDASCLIAAAGSPTGGSGFLLSLCIRRLLRGAVSQAVLLEAERNIRTKLRPQALGVYHDLLQSVPLTIAPVPHVPSGTAWLQVVNTKDVHVVASTLAAKAPYLLTLDQQLGDEINRTALSIEAITPGNFIRSVLPHHIKYPLLRS